MNSITVILALVAVASVSAAGSDIVRHRSDRFGRGAPRGHSSPQIAPDNATGEAEATRHSEVADNVTGEAEAAINTETVTSATVSDETTTATSNDTSKTDDSVRQSTPANSSEATSASANSALAAAIAAAVADEATAANNFASNDNRAADNDAHALALQISLQNQQNRASNAQAVVDQASAIRQRSIINAIAARANSRALAQSADNVAGKRRNHVNSRTSILAGLINAGSARDARINQAAVDSQTASILASSARQMAAIRAQIASINQPALVNAGIPGAGPLGLGSAAGFGW